MEILITLFVIKHWIFDWVLQTEYHAFNKHKITHPAGYIHSAINVLGSILVLWSLSLLPIIVWAWAIPLLIGEFVIHYLMDWTKMNLNTKMGWKPTEHKQFWDLVGFDQMVHTLYLVFMAIMLT